MKYFYVLLFFILSDSSFSQNIFFLQDFKKCPGETDTLIIMGDTSYVWYYSDDPGTILSTSDTLIITTWDDPYITVASPNDTIKFQYFTDAQFCFCQVYIPNIFTPDGDQFNEVFKPIVNCGETQGIRMTIYNRMGKEVFDETSLNAPEWNGTHPTEGHILRQDTYLWWVSFIDEKNKTHHYNGYVILAR